MKVRLAVILPLMLCFVSCKFEPIDPPVTDYDLLQGHWVGHFMKTENGSQILITSPDSLHAIHYEFSDSGYHSYTASGFDQLGVWELHARTIVFDQGESHLDLRELSSKSWEGFSDNRGHGGDMVTTWFYRQ